jgi:hypothetical protein
VHNFIPTSEKAPQPNNTSSHRHPHPRAHMHTNHISRTPARPPCSHPQKRRLRTYKMTHQRMPIRHTQTQTHTHTNARHTHTQAHHLRPPHLRLRMGPLPLLPSFAARLSSPPHPCFPCCHANLQKQVEDSVNRYSKLLKHCQALLIPGYLLHHPCLQRQLMASIDASVFNTFCCFMS